MGLVNEVTVAVDDEGQASNPKNFYQTSTADEASGSMTVFMSGVDMKSGRTAGGHLFSP